MYQGLVRIAFVLKPMGLFAVVKELGIYTSRSGVWKLTLGFVF
jgi:hypothetical protein